MQSSAKKKKEFLQSTHDILLQYISVFMLLCALHFCLSVCICTKACASLKRYKLLVGWSGQMLFHTPLPLCSPAFSPPVNMHQFSWICSKALVNFQREGSLPSEPRFLMSHYRCPSPPPRVLWVTPNTGLQIMEEVCIYGNVWVRTRNARGTHGMKWNAATGLLWMHSKAGPSFERAVLFISIILCIPKIMWQLVSGEKFGSLGASAYFLLLNIKTRTRKIFQNPRH